MLRVFFARFLGMFRQRRMDEESDEEVQHHLNLLAERFQRQGMPPEEARCAARRQFGGLSQTRYDLREMRALPALEAWMQDFRRAFRQLWRAKRFTAAAALTLALGVGASTAVFAVLDAVVLRPLPFVGAERLMAFRRVDARGAPHQLSYPEFFDYRRLNQPFEHLVCYREADFTLSDSLPAIQVTGQIVSWDLFSLLGVQPALGRGFLPHEEEPGSHAVVLSHALWRNRFGGARAILGRSVRINGGAFTVAGVAQAGFQFPVDAPAVDLWVTVSEDSAARGQRGARMLDAIGRLKPGISAAQAQAQMNLVADALARQHPDAKDHARTLVLPEQGRVAGRSLKLLLILAGSAGMLLLIACANVANLLLARNAERARDFAMRTALGASRARTVRQVLMEGVALGLLGAAGGVLLASGIVKTIVSAAREYMPRVAHASIDDRVLAFSIALAVLTSVFFSLAPAVQATRASPAGGLKAGA